MRFSPARDRRLAQAVRLGPGRPAVLLGLRVALATGAPLVLASVLGPMTAWATTGGFTVALADKGGAYASRARQLGAITIGGALAVLLGGATSTHPVLGALAMLVLTSACAFVGVLGPTAASAGTTIAVLFAISIAIPPASTIDLVHRALAVLGSGAWSMLLALLLWPVRVYRPARFAVARCVRALADHVGALEHSLVEASGDAWFRRSAQEHAAIRDALEAARAILVATRRGRRAESSRGAQLLVLVQVVETCFGTMIALEEVIESLADRERLRASLGVALKGVDSLLDDLAARVETEAQLRPEPPIELSLAVDLGEDELARAHHAQAESLVARLADQLHAGFVAAQGLYAETPTRATDQPTIDQAPSAWGTLREDLTSDSVWLRHAIRVGITSTVAVTLTTVLHLSRGYWVTLSVVVMLQPYGSATLVRALQRVGGTLLGGLAAAGVLAIVPDLRLLVFVSPVLAGVSAAVLQLNYALFTLCLTPTFVLLAEATARDPRLPQLRIVNTVIGAALALVGSRLIWPLRERSLFDDEAARAMTALRDYHAEMVRVGSTRPAPTVREARRRFGLAINTADAALQRLLLDSAPRDPKLEPAMTMLLFMRRVSATIGAASSARAVANIAAHGDDERVANVLDDLATSLRAHRKPRALPSLEATRASPLIAARAARIADQLRVLHDAIGRLQA